MSMYPEDPRRAGGVEQLRGFALYGARVGDHGAVFDVRDDARVIRVIRIRHRRDVYRRLR